MPSSTASQETKARLNRQRELRAKLHDYGQAREALGISRTPDRIRQVERARTAYKHALLRLIEAAQEEGAVADHTDWEEQPEETI